MANQTSFKEELRRSLIKHALTPCIILGVLCLFGFVIGSYVSIVHNNKVEMNSYRERFIDVVNLYMEQSEKTAKSLEINKFREDKQYRVKIISDMYDFLNSVSHRGHFYIFDEDVELIYSSETEHITDSIITNQIIGNKARIIHNQENLIYVYDSHELDLKPISAYLIFNVTYKQGHVDAISGYVVDVDDIGHRRVNGSTTVLLVNKYNRVLNCRESPYINQRGKLLNNFNLNKGLVKHNHRWYYVANTPTHIGDSVVYSITDCTTTVHISMAFSVFLMVIFLLIAVMIRFSADRFSRNKTAIIYQLKEALSKVEEGQLDISLHIDSGDEFGAIGNSFNMMLGSIRHLIYRHEQLAYENTLATIQVMESQFNPHFLFNTLESIKYMIKFDADAAQKILVSLSKLLRYSIQNNDDVVHVGEEVDFLVRYAEIMKVRYGDSLVYSINIEESAKDVYIPRMILQPIVENSIKYGFGDNIEVLRIDIAVKSKNDNIYIHISDNGNGIEEGLLKKLSSNLSKKLNQTKHIGLYNVHKRIALLYGKDYGIKLISKKVNEGTEESLKEYAAVKQGTYVIIKLPKIEKEQLND